MVNSILIIVPTLNSYKILPNLVNSLKKQTSDFWRLLFIDGQSNDKHKNYLDLLCSKEKNISFINQDLVNPGIYGAMNLGLNYINPHEWILFWGSDDLAYNRFLIEDLIQTINHEQFKDLDLIFNDAIYIDKFGQKERRSSFKIINNNLRLSLFLGFTPPHQGCLFSPKVIKKMKSYSLNYFLAADLDCFLRMAFMKNIEIKYFEKILVKMSKGGASGRMIKKRLKEVSLIYKKYFGFLFFIPFITRYIIRIWQYILKK